MPNYIEKVESMSLPVIPMSETVVFPTSKINFDTSDPVAVEAAMYAAQTSMLALAVTKRNAPVGESVGDDLFNVGTVVKITKIRKVDNMRTNIAVEGMARAYSSSFSESEHGKFLTAKAMCKTYILADNGGARGEALSLAIVNQLSSIMSYLSANTNASLSAIKAMQDIGTVADFVASNVLIKTTDKQLVLEEFDPFERAELLISLLESEREILECELKIHKKVRARLDKNQRDYYLREQIHAIEEELGDDTESETETYKKKILAAKMPPEVTEALLRENSKVAKLQIGSPEANVLRTHIETCLELPWNKATKDRVDTKKARTILDRDHDGLEKVKERILEFLAVKQLNPDIKNQILCLIGPPGTGKTSVAASIASAMNRKYVRVSLGGVRDEADIRGHRKTYIGSMPGRIINAIKQAGVKNPLILLDEIDKLTRDAHGDPSSALLEVLDSEQNKSFRDHFIEFPFDLSECIFVATANSYEGIPKPLLDRMEVIELKIYTKREKLSIAKNHLIPKQLKRHGLTKKSLKITDGAITELIDHYTKEAGVRNLERTIGDLCRKAAREILESDCKTVRIDTDSVEKYLGNRKIRTERIGCEDEVGTVNGLAYTELGGDLLKIEAAVLDGSGKIELTGSLGDVMQESAKIAVSYVRSIANEYNIPTDFYKTKDIHINAPEGAIPKDGPSAGVTMVTALVSALSGIPVKRDVAMTGEITLRGNLLAIGGLKEKTMAAYNAGVKKVIIPFDNLRDLDEIDPLARENLEFVPCKKLSEVLSEALAVDTQPQETKKTELDKKATLAELAAKIDTTPSISKIR